MSDASAADISNRKIEGGPLDPVLALFADGASLQVSEVVMPTAVLYGQKTVPAAGTPVQLGTGGLSSGVKVKALSGNSGDIYVGDSNVGSSNGYVLAAGEEVFVEIDNLSRLYINAGTNDDGVSFIGS